MTDQSGSVPAGPFSLLVIKDGDTGKAIDLAADREYVIGRSEECDIRIDPSDKMVSRKHVRLKVGTKSIVLENLSQTNPVQVKGKIVTSTVLKTKDKFQVGGTVFLVNGPKEAKAAASRKPDKKVFLLAGVVALCLLLLVVIFTGKKEAPVQPLSVTRPGSGNPGLAAKASLPDKPSSLPPASGMNISDKDREMADQHFRQGLFFYDTGNILRAVGEWERAVSVNPEHKDARLWFLKAEMELEEMVKNHYQNAMLHYKYMRYDQAEYEFKMVIELARDKKSDQYISALRYIDELRSK